MDDKDKQYLVMPIAEGGDLAKPGRIASTRTRLMAW
jgi:hypothetical protein